jgi:hypothetical protein
MAKDKAAMARGFACTSAAGQPLRRPYRTGTEPRKNRHISAV